MTSTASTGIAPDLILYGVNPTGEEIGTGAYGRVFEVNYEGTFCAAKEIHEVLLKLTRGSDLQRIRDDFVRECQIWSTLRHPCLVQFLGVYYPATDYIGLPTIVMEKMQQSLTSFVEQYSSIPINVKLSILNDVCLGLRYLHSKDPPILHRDLTPNNILLSNYLEAKITDLGVAKAVQSKSMQTMTQAPGTGDFMPPEALVDKPLYGLPLDVFSLGLVILFAIIQEWPHPISWVQFDSDTGNKVYLSEVQRRQHHLDKITGDLKPLVISCINDNPKERPSVVQVSAEIIDAMSVYNENCGGELNSIQWWAIVSGKERASQMNLQSQQQQLISLAAQLKRLKAVTEDQRKENAKLILDNDNLKSENKRLGSENEQLKTENQQLKDHQHSDASNKPMNIEWKRGASVPTDPKAGRAYHTAVFLNGIVLVGGGKEHCGRVESFEINCYHVSKNLWSIPIPTTYCLFAMTTLENHLIIAGGKDSKNKQTSKIFYLEKNESKDTYKMIEYTRMPKSRSMATAVGHQGKLIITGGYDDKDNVVASTELFDSITKEWHTCDDLPVPHCRLQPAVVDNTLYLLGGDNQDGVLSAAVFSAPLATLAQHKISWSTCQDDTPWLCSIPVTIQDRYLLTLGGCARQIGTSADICLLNEDSHCWEVVGILPFERAASAAVTVDGNKIIVIGGRKEDNSYCNAVWIGYGKIE